MKLRSLILATIVLLALVGTLYWSEHRKPEDDTAKASPDSPAILKLDASSITQLEIKKKATDPVVLTKNSLGAWQITEPKPFADDPTIVSATLSSLSSLNSQRVVEDKASDLRQYGLDQPFAEVDVTEKANNSQKLLLGDDTPSSSATYVMLVGDPRIFTIPSFNKTMLVKSVNDLRDKRLLPVNLDQVSRVDLIRKTQTIEFGRTKDEWQILQPQISRSDSTRISDFVEKLTGAKMDLSGPDADTKETASAFASGTPVGTAKLTTASGEQELQIRKNKDTYYARSSAVDGVYKVAAILGQAFDKNPDDFRNKKLFDVGFADPNKVEMQIGAKSYSLTRNVHDWSSDGNLMDVDPVGMLLSDIRDLTADKFVASGLANPTIANATIHVTVTWDDGKRIEKVSFAKSTDGYIAKREGDPTLYHLAAGSVDTLQQGADNLKPAQKK